MSFCFTSSTPSFAAVGSFAFAFLKAYGPRCPLALKRSRAQCFSLQPNVQPKSHRLRLLSVPPPPFVIGDVETIRQQLHSVRPSSTTDAPSTAPSVTFGVGHARAPSSLLADFVASLLTLVEPSSQQQTRWTSSSRRTRLLPWRKSTTGTAHRPWQCPSRLAMYLIAGRSRPHRCLITVGAILLSVLASSTPSPHRRRQPMWPASPILAGGLVWSSR
ncbi:hypothetical protein DFH06DRAFT_560555 [Mycena polygramma]|nr:hypothetical protein DFH06DRAFT_560555 [Mycena polygramma]